MRFTRRKVLQFTSLAPFVAAGRPALAEARVFRHGSTLFDKLKYQEGFARFDYVNADAPKGGRLRMAALGTFDSLNPYTIKGDSVNPGVNETLTKRALDEPSSEYGLLADGLWFPDDYGQVIYRLRPEARFSDGEPVKPSDVVFSFNAQKANNTPFAAYYADVAKVEQTGEHEVTFAFSKTGNRELPHIVGQIAVLPEHWWTAKDATGKPRDIASNTLEPIIGSGPYAIAAVKPGQSILVKRVADYWGKDLPVTVGINNFDEIETQFYQDRAVMQEAFKGDQFDIQYESSSKQWAQGYDFPAVTDGRVRKEVLPRLGVMGMQCWCVNLRRAKFQDARVRRALDLAFDFEWSNANLFYGLYTRSRSFFNNSELEAKGLPGPDELKLLEPLKDKIPPAVFTEEYVNPVNSTAQDRRKNLRAAQALLAESGWKPVQEAGRQVLKNEKGETFRFTVTLDSPTFERVALPYKEQLALLGFDVTIQTIDDAQYKRVTGDFDYDMIVMIWGQSLSPGNEQREFFGSAFADRTKSRNAAGIKDVAVDSLIDSLVTAPDRPAIIAACRALDRVLMANHYVIPMWFKPADWVASWTRVAHPEKLPGYSPGYPDIWWFDAAADARLKKA
ncbi:MAG: extracellular solute-binding protein [Hyphomicrobiales bacterium]